MNASRKGMDEFLNGNFCIGKFEDGLSTDHADFGEGQIYKLVFKSGCICRSDFGEQAAVDFGEECGCIRVQFHAKTPADAHFCGGDSETAFAEVVCRFDKFILNGLMVGALHMRIGCGNIGYEFIFC